MAGSIKIYTYSFVVLTMLAASTFTLPASEPASDSSAGFARREACHPEKIGQAQQSFK